MNYVSVREVLLFIAVIRYIQQIQLIDEGWPRMEYDKVFMRMCALYHILGCFLWRTE